MWTADETYERIDGRDSRRDLIAGLDHYHKTLAPPRELPVKGYNIPPIFKVFHRF